MIFFCLTSSAGSPGLWILAPRDSRTLAPTWVNLPRLAQALPHHPQVLRESPSSSPHAFTYRRSQEYQHLPVTHPFLSRGSDHDFDRCFVMAERSCITLPGVNTYISLVSTKCNPLCTCIPWIFILALGNERDLVIDQLIPEHSRPSYLQYTLHDVSASLVFLSPPCAYPPPTVLPQGVSVAPTKSIASEGIKSRKTMGPSWIGRCDLRGSV